MGNSIKLAQHFPYEGEIIEGHDIRIQPILGLGKIMLQRSIPTKDEVVSAIASETGLDIPLNPCRASIDPSSDITVISIGPNMWDIVCKDTDTKGILSRINDATMQNNIFATDMSDQLICMEIDGPNALEFLSRGCALDLRKNVFKAGHSARSLLAQANVILWRMDEDKYRILFDVSLWNYLWQWMTETASGLEG